MMEQSLDIMSLIAYNMNVKVKIYRDEQGNEPFTEWLESIRDRVAQARIRSRLRRILSLEPLPNSRMSFTAGCALCSNCSARHTCSIFL